MSAERRTRWTDDHGDKPLGSKFHVYCAADERGEVVGQHRYAASDRLGATGEFVFVLRPESDEAAWLALREYFPRNQQLAADIRAQLYRIQEEQR